MVVRKSCYLGGCVEGLQKGSTVWRGFGSNGAHTGNGEVSASSRVEWQAVTGRAPSSPLMKGSIYTFHE